MRIKPAHILSILSLLLPLSGAASAPSLSAHAKALRQVASDSIVSAYIIIDRDALDRDALASLGVSIALEAGDMATVRFPLRNLDRIAATEGVRHISTATAARPMLDIAKGETGMTSVHSGTSLPTGFSGKGVVVGVVDCGFDYTHNAFRTSDGELRISRVWEQATEPSGSLTSPEQFGYGTELPDAESIAAAGGDIRNNSHGTHVASIAAGSDVYLDGSLRGMAPDAEIVLVSMPDGGIDNVNISNAIAYIFNYADQVAKPCVINLSLGSHSGPHDGTSPFDCIADRLQGPGRLIVGSSGNHRSNKFHIRHDFSAAETTPLRTFIDYLSTPSASNTGGEVEIWAEQGAIKEVALMAWKLSTGEAAERVVVFPTETDEPAEISLGRNISGSLTAVCATSPLNGKTHILLTSDVRSIRTDYAVALEVVPEAGAVDVWADNIKLGLADRGAEGFSAPADESTVCEIGGTAKRILTVGAYATRSSYTLLGETIPRTSGETDGELCSFSSCGPTADGRMKPDLTAPGSMISAAVSANDNSGTILRSQYYSDDTRDYSYGYMQGTSMASPAVAGIVATWLEAYPDMTPEILAEVVSQTCRSDVHTATLPSNLWGHGKVDALEGIRECIRRADTESVSGVTADRGASFRLQSCRDGKISLMALHDFDNFTAEIYDITGRLICKYSHGRADAGSLITIDAETAAPTLGLLKVGATSMKIRL